MFELYYNSIAHYIFDMSPLLSIIFLVLYPEKSSPKGRGTFGCGAIGACQAVGDVEMVDYEDAQSRCAAEILFQWKIQA